MLTGRNKTMKKNIGSVVGLYPTPSTMIGTVVEGNVNWCNVAHIGIIGLEDTNVKLNYPK